MRAKLLVALIVGTVASVYLSTSAVAQMQMAAGHTYICPAPQQVMCVPSPSTIGPWHSNGGMMTGNTFAPNNQCANVITLAPDKQRLLCCYEKCGVFIQDVPAKHCTKSPSGSEFLCE
jgi:hypothetical protein